LFVHVHILLSNAIEFTPEHGVIHFGIDAVGGVIEAIVKATVSTVSARLTAAMAFAVCART
jgi:signal transduction histidine kinase